MESLLALVLFISLCSNPIIVKASYPSDYYASNASIHLYGETHGLDAFYEAELQEWQKYYANGERYLFVELPYYTAEFLNIWMSEDNDDILMSLYDDLEGTLSHTEYFLDFYRSIKKTCPETIFYGTDVGHQNESTGTRYLDYLKEHDLEDSANYALTMTCMEQGEYYYEHSDEMYRENKMVDNFVSAYQRASAMYEGETMEIMGIYGSYHTNMSDSNVMSAKLRNLFGDTIDCIYIGNVLMNREPYQLGFSYGGLLFLLALLIPNILWAKHKPKDYYEYATKESKVLGIFERIGEVLVTTILICFKDFDPFIVLTNEGPIIPPRTLLLAVVIYMFAVYEGYWIQYFRSPKEMKDMYTSYFGVPLAGAVAPVIAAFIMGIYGNNYLLVVSSIILGIGHIGIHYGHYKEVNESI